MYGEIEKLSVHWNGCPPKQCLQWKLYFAK